MYRKVDPLHMTWLPEERVAGHVASWICVFMCLCGVCVCVCVCVGKDFFEGRPCFALTRSSDQPSRLTIRVHVRENLATCRQSPRFQRIRHDSY